VDALIQLNQWARGRAEDDQRQAANLQWAALFADLRDNFSHRPANRMPMGCLLLLDNVDTQLGRIFLTGLIDAQRGAAMQGPMPLTVVATSRGALLARRSAPEVADIDTTNPVNPRARPTWLRYRLPDLTEDEVADLAAVMLHGRGPRHADKLVYGFTGGHPLSTRALLAAMAQHKSDRAGLIDLLGRDVPDDLAATATLEQWLCARLLGVADPAAVLDTATEYLTTCAAARDVDAAAYLLPTAVRENVMKRIAEVNLWNRAEGRGVDVLRRLLLRRLADRKPADRSNGWYRVHARLSMHCAGEEDEAGELYHALALGDLSTVTGRLTARLDGPGSWVPLLTAVTQAPCRQPIDDATLDDLARAEPTAAPTTASPPGPDAAPDPRPELVRHLVACLWTAADPLAQVDRCDLHAQIADTFRGLAAQCTGRERRTELKVAARHHDAVADQWN
jgi:hypothetical protein